MNVRLDALMGIDDVLLGVLPHVSRIGRYVNNG
jgi:hypothetical protein